MKAIIIEEQQLQQLAAIFMMKINEAASSSCGDKPNGSVTPRDVNYNFQIFLEKLKESR